jgi:hypothetical protein
VVENLQALAPVVGVYLFFAACFWALIWFWIRWEDRNDGGTNNDE